MSDAPQHEAHRRPHTPSMADPFMEFDLPAEIHRLHDEAAWNTGQNARTLIKYDDFRVVLIANLRLGGLLALDRGVSHDVHALEESALLLTIAWPGRTRRIG